MDRYMTFLLLKLTVDFRGLLCSIVHKASGIDEENFHPQSFLKA